MIIAAGDFEADIMRTKQSELTVITKAKDLCTYIMTITEKSPKKYRFTLVSKLQNLALSVIENIYRANEPSAAKIALRRTHIGGGGYATAYFIQGAP